MKFARIISVCVFLSFIMVPGNAQTENWPKTLLWKIERSDLKKPSFLFGTMHLQDKRLFNLGDSFYHYFEKAEGFAIEVNFNEYIDSLLGRTFNSVEDEQLNDGEEGIKDVRIDTTSNIEIPPPPKEELKNNKYFKKYFRKIRNERTRRLLVYGEMPTILDAYLYGMAMKQGKWLGAVEEVKDQLNMMDEFGKDLDEDDMNETEEKMMFTLDNMIKIYLNKDLDKIEQYAVKGGSSRMKAAVFTNRNVKMAHSIDSLSHSRSMFYAVGAAHLPGDSGVIKLLRAQGYTVTPVYSTTTLAAEKYAENLPALAWRQVTQADSLYTIDMPGIPTDYNMFGDLVKMKVLVDMTTMTFFMTGHTISQFDESKLTDVLKGMAQSMGGNRGKLENVKQFEQSGLKGVEGQISGGGVFFKVQVLTNNSTAFFLLLGSNKKTVINTPDAGKFFASFRTNGKQQSVTPKDWALFDLPEKAFSVSMPAKPKRNKTFEKQALNSGWNFTVYDCTDLSAGLYYLMQIRDIEPGHFLEGDSLYFSSFSENMVGDGTETYNEHFSTVSGFPAMRLDAVNEKESLFYKTKNIIRGNRVYSMMVLGNISKKDEKGPDRYFDSFRISDYVVPESKTYSSDDLTFSTLAPGNFVIAKKEEYEQEDSTRKHYTCYSPNDAVSYELLKDYLPRYYWSADDTTFYKEKASAYKAYTDSVLSYKKITNGNLRGVEQIVELKGSNNLRKVRFLLHGDTLYTLITYVPTQYINNKEHSAFFDQFRVKNDNITTTAFNSKATQLFKALQAKDSATFEEAKTYLSSATFSKKDLPFLHDALLYNYQDDTLNYGSVTSRLINAFDGLSDSSTVDFIRNNYSKINASKEDNKAAMLNVLANYQSGYSYALLKELLINKTPEKLVTRKSIGYQLNDSLLLTKSLYPEYLGLLRKPDFWEDVTQYTAELLDSNMLDKEILRPYEKDLLHIADTLLKGTTLTEEDAWLWNYRHLLYLLGYLNTGAANDLLQQYVSIKDLDLKQAAVISLLRNKQVVTNSETEKLAADNGYRIDFYEELKKIGRESVFPSKYRTQRYFAEAHLFNYGDEDYTPTSMEYIGDREAIFDGEKRRFFLFKLVFSYDDEDKKKKESYLGMAGPFPLDSKITDTNNDATEIMYDEEYDKKEVDSQFAALLKKGEEYIKKKNK